ncbi:MAG: hypothetical protein KME32_17370 [Mojavia pulchra JT2-VF2]|jgi:hypothetical protein|uniref:Uncharacterized protein n=1 Tax=Mojavia pulchra JT2-VF2 TaxID=287848 RepID=A0A951Q136_9NOST|nr:hypothetical protein [Mojavia pulchra JT2-VF2]
MNNSIQFLGFMLVVSQSLTLTVSQAQVVTEPDNKNPNNSVPVSSDSLPNQNTNVPPQANVADNSNSKTVVSSKSESSESLAVTKTSSRIPVSSRIFNAPSMQQ